MRIRTAREGRDRDASSAFATPHTHGRTSCIRARQKISVTFWESSGDDGQGRSSMAPSASRRGRTAPSSASSPMTRLLLSLNRSLSATIVSKVSLRYERSRECPSHDGHNGIGGGQHICCSKPKQAVSRIDHSILAPVVARQVFPVASTVVLKRKAVQRVVEVWPPHQMTVVVVERYLSLRPWHSRQHEY